LGLIAFLPYCIGVSGQTAPANHLGINPTDSEGILNQLAPDGVPPHSLALKPAEKARAIRLLVAVKRDETEWHRLLAIYLLATLGYEYERNRDELVRIWQSSDDDGTMELITDLYEQGHKELLRSLMARGNGENVSTSEGWGYFLGDQIEKNPRDFLAALAKFSSNKQLMLCTCAGQQDGGGMAPETERKVIAKLKDIDGDVALRCARGVRIGNRYAEEDAKFYAEAESDKKQKQQKK
jgi:hypothetical protein